ncbi:hypothetical protein H8E88_06470 [candidate division KSB1 bacterium]|nr:hypothetical protein [candidate division KSB1 bacterium]
MFQNNPSITAFLLFVNLLVVANLANAQWNFSLSYDQEYNDNPFHLPEAESSWISSLQFGAEHESNKLTVGYYGNYSHFNNILDRNFYLHQLALFGGSDTTGWGFFGEQRINKSGYNIYDYKDLNGIFRHRFSIAGIVANWQSKIQFNFYDQLSELNNWKLNSNLRFHKSFQTRTTIIAGVGVDYKNYLNSSNLTEIESDTSLTNPTTEMGTGQGNGKGNGKGYRRGEENGFLTETSYVDLENPSVMQISFWLRLAQSITPTTGLAFSYYNRTLLSGQDRFISGISYSYNQESEIFNDPLGFESHSIGTELSKLLPMEVMLKLAGFYVKKNYSAQGIYIDEENYDESTLRKDKYKTFYFNLKKDFEFIKGSTLALSLYYQWISNNSNSYWNNYKNNFCSIGLEFGF